MTRIEITTKVGADGVLTIPVGREEANRKVRVTVEPEREAISQEEWHRFVRETAGSIPDPAFKRYDQGQFEERESLD